MNLTKAYKCFFLFGALSLIPLQTFAKTSHWEYPKKVWRYRLTLTDKGNSPYSINHPEEFLSEKSIARRVRLGMQIDEKDLPISPTYLSQLTDYDIRIHCLSKWLNTVVVEIKDSTYIDTLTQLSFVQSAKLVYVSPDSILIDDRNRKDFLTNQLDSISPDKYYGLAQHQVEMLNLIPLHNEGFRGEGITIAVTDGGFFNTDIIPSLRRTRILGTRNFVSAGESVYKTPQQHGTNVLSCIGTNNPYTYVGTAPKAQFYLLQTEDSGTEQLIEEDNWCAAVEYADSLGCDIVTSSLGYVGFDNKDDSVQYWELDGNTHQNSREASLAASRGLVILNSAGNSADENWKKIGVPADAFDIITVGAVSADSINTNFSSLGYTADGRVKPDVCAQGGRTQLIRHNGLISRANGTSFSTPVLCGAVACLMQAHPTATPVQIIDALHKAGHYAERPNEVYGYGIPDIVKAHKILSNEK